MSTTTAAAAAAANPTPPSSPSTTTRLSSSVSSPPRKLRHPPRTVLPATTSPQSFTLNENPSTSSLDLPRLRRRPRASSGASAMSVASSSGSRQTDYSLLGLSKESLTILENSEGNGVVVGVIRRVKNDTRKRGLRRVKGDVAEVRRASGDTPRPVTSDGRAGAERRPRNTLPTPESSPSPGEKEVGSIRALHHPKPYRMPERRTGEERRAVSEGSGLRGVQRGREVEEDEEDGGAPLYSPSITQKLSSTERAKDPKRKINIIIPSNASKPVGKSPSPPLIVGFSSPPQNPTTTNHRPQAPFRKDSENYTPTTPFPTSEDETLTRHVSNKLPPRARIVTPPKRMNSEKAEVMSGGEDTPTGPRDIGSVIALEFGMDKPLKMRALSVPRKEEDEPRLSMELSSSPEVKTAVLVRMGSEKRKANPREQSQKVIVPPVSVEGPKTSTTSLAEVDPRIRSSSIAKRRLSLTIPADGKRPVVELHQEQKPVRQEHKTSPPPPPPPTAQAVPPPSRPSETASAIIGAGQTVLPIGLSKVEVINTKPPLKKRTTSSSSKYKSLPTPPTSDTSKALVPTTSTQQPPPPLPTPKSNPSVFIHTPREARKPPISRSSTARSSKSTKSSNSVFGNFTVPSLPRFNFIPATPLPLMSPSATLAKQLGETVAAPPKTNTPAPPAIIHEENEDSDSDTCSTCSSSSDDDEDPANNNNNNNTAVKRPRRPRPRPMSPQYRNSKLHPWWRPRSVNPGDEALRRALTGTPSKFTVNSAGVGPEYFAALDKKDNWTQYGGGLVKVDKKRKVIGIGGVRVEWVGLGGLWGRVTGAAAASEKKDEEKKEEAKRKKDEEAMRKKKEDRHREWEKRGQEIVRGQSYKGKEVEVGAQENKKEAEKMVAGGTRKINLKRKGWI